MLFNLPLHFLDHDCQFFLAFLFGGRVDIPSDALAIGADWGVFALPEVVVDLVHAAGTGLAVLRLVGLKATLVGVLLLFFLRRHGSVGFADLVVDFHRRLLLHMVAKVCRRSWTRIGQLRMPQERFRPMIGRTKPIGMWGRQYLRYIKAHRPVLHTTLILSGKPNSHLAEIDNREEDIVNTEGIYA